MSDRFGTNTENAEAEASVEPLFVRLPEAERMLGLRRTKLLELAYAGEIPSVRVGTARLFPVAGLRAWASAQLRAAGLVIDEPR